MAEEDEIYVRCVLRSSEWLNYIPYKSQYHKTSIYDLRGKQTFSLEHFVSRLPKFMSFMHAEYIHSVPKSLHSFQH